MQLITIDKDIPLICVKAESFPQGIAPAFEKLHSLNLPMAGRILYGLSRPENAEITYYAGVTENAAGEAARAGCETRTVKKGTYISDTIRNYMTDLQLIGNKFAELLETDGLDPEGYCVEQYISDKDVVCMIRLAE